MDSNKRACLAFVVGWAVNQNMNSVYDFTTGRLFMFSPSGRVDNMQVLDHQRHCWVTGSLASLYDFGSNSYVSINMNIGSFTGFDYGSSSYFSGNVSGNVVMLYDGQNGTNNTYSLM